MNITTVTVDTESSAATDDLTSITGGVAGDIIILQCASNSRSVVCKSGTSLVLQADFTLSSTADKLTLICYSTSVWHELNRASNS